MQKCFLYIKREIFYLSPFSFQLNVDYTRSSTCVCFVVVMVLAPNFEIVNLICVFFAFSLIFYSFHIFLFIFFSQYQIYDMTSQTFNITKFQ
jgi:hypothetical protein